MTIFVPEGHILVLWPPHPDGKQEYGLYRTFEVHKHAIGIENITGHDGELPDLNEMSERVKGLDK